VVDHEAAAGDEEELVVLVVLVPKLDVEPREIA
jgi:hypothetical protein